MRLLVCGSRDWTDPDPLQTFLDVHLIRCFNVRPFAPLIIIEGEARGADTLAKRWAQCWIVHNWYWGKLPTVGLDPFPADWERYGKAAGPIRNTQMLKEGKPDMVVGFSRNIDESRGTANMLVQAHKAGLPTILIGGLDDLTHVSLR